MLPFHLDGWPVAAAAIPSLCSQRAFSDASSMCGIVGRFNYLSHRPVAPALIAGMCDYVRHRGPDDLGTFSAGAVALGHRRLAVIDLSAAGHQPMTSADGARTIVFNGEIYNFRELATTLEARGYRFRSRSDTEVILAAFDAFGVECLAHLRGMFAFAIWDARDRALFLARDRLGAKPLHYHVDRDGIAFASEPRAFFADPGFVADPDPTALWHYLECHFVPAAHHAFRGVCKLPPAHYLLVRDGAARVCRYWRLRYEPKIAIHRDHAVEEVTSRLEEAVRLRLVSDVPLGAFLSGGLDSGLVVALMTRLGAAPVRTFTIGFDDPRYDERPLAQLVADRYRTEHRAFRVRAQIGDLLPRLVWHYSEPYGDSSAIPTYYLAQLTRQHVTVALNGDAGDENFAGYTRYRAHRLASRLDRLFPPFMRRGLAVAGRRLARGATPKHVRFDAARFLEGLAETPARRYARWLTQVDPAVRLALVTPEFARAIAATDGAGPIEAMYNGTEARDPVETTLDVDVNTYLPDDLLVKVDIATMAHALEARSPFLDHALMEYVARLPSSFKLNGSTSKYLLRRIAADLLPREILEHRKSGFGVPMEHWLRTDLRDLSHELLLSGRLAARGLLRPDAVRRLVDDHEAGRRSWHSQIWSLMMLEGWFRTFVDGRPAPADSRDAVAAAVDESPRR